MAGKSIASRIEKLEQRLPAGQPQLYWNIVFEPVCVEGGCCDKHVTGVKAGYLLNEPSVVLTRNPGESKAALTERAVNAVREESLERGAATLFVHYVTPCHRDERSPETEGSVRH